MFLKALSLTDFDTQRFTTDTQSNFNEFYAVAIGLLNQFYPERSVSLTSRDPSYMTPAIKAMLRRKNRLMHAGRTEEAGALARRIGKDIARRCSGRFTKIDSKSDSKKLWEAVRQFTGRKRNIGTRVRKYHDIFENVKISKISKIS